MAGGKKVYSYQEVLKHNGANDCWLIIADKVYDLSPFMEEHPGGAEILLACTGKDATQDYEDIGHTESAKEMMPQYCIGEVDVSTVPASAKLAYAVRQGPAPAPATGTKSSVVWRQVLQLAVPVALLLATFAAQSFAKGKVE